MKLFGVCTFRKNIPHILVQFPKEKRVIPNSYMYCILYHICDKIKEKQHLLSSYEEMYPGQVA